MFSYKMCFRFFFSNENQVLFFREYVDAVNKIES